MNQYSQDIMDKLRALKPTLMKEMKIKRLRVFGSVARGEAKEGSDVDLIVDFEEVPDLFTFAGMRRKVSENIQTPVDFMTERSLHPLMKDQILSEARDV